MQLVFKAASGAQFASAKANMYGQELFRLSKEHDGLTPETVVKEARNIKSPLHECFEWDDGMAAGYWRIHQARQILNHFLIVKKVNGEDREIKAFFNVNIEDSTNGKSRYMTVFSIAESADFRGQVLKGALEEIKSWRQRYDEYKELGLIFGAIEETQRKLKL